MSPLPRGSVPRRSSPLCSTAAAAAGPGVRAMTGTFPPIRPLCG